jgi:hypothetical protein
MTLLGYIWRDSLRSHRWVAPVLVFMVAVAILSANSGGPADTTSGGALPAFGAIAALSLFVAIWLTVIISNVEDPVQCAVTASTAGSTSKVRIAKLGISLIAASILGLLGLIPAGLTSPPVTTRADVVSGVVGVIATCTAGVSIGAMCSMPIIGKTSWALLFGVIAGFATILIPHCPPTRQLLVLFGNDPTGSFRAATLAAAGETVVVAALIVAASVELAWRRT